MADLVEVQKLAAVRYVSRWQLEDGTVIETPLTAKAYAALGATDAGEPARPANVPATAKWLCSAGGVPIFDTADGKLQFGCFNDRGNGKIWLGLDQLDPVSVTVASKAVLLAADEVIAVKGETFQLRAGTVEKL